MTTTFAFLDDPGNTREEIMRATYLALREHGYADLTIQRIADEFPKSKSLLYHHYDGKDDLLLDFLEFMVEQYEDRIPLQQGEDADAYLDAVLDRALASPLPEKQREFTRAMVELRAQAAHDEAYRDHFSRSDEFFRKQMAHVIRSGVEQGVFREVDAKAMAALVHTVVVGTMTQRVTSDGDPVDRVRHELDEWLDDKLRRADE